MNRRNLYIKIWSRSNNWGNKNGTNESRDKSY